MTEEKSKERLNVVFVGHVDSGKSTIIGRLLHETGCISDEELEKLRAVSVQRRNSSTAAYAFVMDKLKDERDRGITIKHKYVELITETRKYTVTDVPGHRFFLKHMITGSSQADVAVLVVPAWKGCFEISMERSHRRTGHTEGGTRSHVHLCALFGIRQFIVVVTCMDSRAVNYSQQRFEEIQSEVKRLLQKANLSVHGVAFIPVSGLNGDNLTTVSTKMPWYTGFEIKIKKKKFQGHTLLDAMNLANTPKRNTDAPLRVPISEVYQIKGVGTIVCGKIEQGTLVPGQIVIGYPSDFKGTVAGIQMFHTPKEKALAGDIVGVKIKLTKDDCPFTVTLSDMFPVEISRLIMEYVRKLKTGVPSTGDVLSLLKPVSNILRPAVSFTASVFVHSLPHRAREGSFTPTIFVRTGMAPYKMTKINWKKMPSKAHSKKIDNARFLSERELAEVTWEATTHKRLCMTPYDQCNGFGRMAAIVSNRLSMIGKITKVNYWYN